MSDFLRKTIIRFLQLDSKYVWWESYGTDGRCFEILHAEYFEYEKRIKELELLVAAHTAEICNLERNVERLLRKVGM